MLREQPGSNAEEAAPRESHPKIPKDIQYMIYSFFDEMAVEGEDSYWHASKWKLVSWNGQLDLLFLQSRDPAWMRDDYKPYEQVLTDFFHNRGFPRFQLGFYSPGRERPQPEKKDEPEL